jgi:hypothetical protein
VIEEEQSRGWKKENICLSTACVCIMCVCVVVIIIRSHGWKEKEKRVIHWRGSNGQKASARRRPAEKKEKEMREKRN